MAIIQVSTLVLNPGFLLPKIYAGAFRMWKKCKIFRVASMPRRIDQCSLQVGRLCRHRKCLDLECFCTMAMVQSFLGFCFDTRLWFGAFTVFLWEGSSGYAAIGLSMDSDYRVVKGSLFTAILRALRLFAATVVLGCIQHG